MKLIVVIKPACRRPRGLLRHVYLHEGRMGRECAAILPDGDRVVGYLNGLDAGTITRNPATDARSLCGHVPNGRAALRHVVLSFEDMRGNESRNLAFEALADLGEQWIQAHAPYSSFIGIMHDDRNHPHLHLMVANCDESNGDARLAWSPADLREMQSLKWVSPATTEKFSIETGRHNGLSRREGRGMPYPSLLLDAAKLAMATAKELENYEHANIITVSRRSKSGEIKSINFNGRRIRLSTIRQLAHAGQGLGVQKRKTSGRRIQRRSRTRPGLA